MKRLIGSLFLVLSLSIALIACDHKGKGGDGVGNPFAYPAAADQYEGTGGDDSPATAGAIALGTTQLRTIYPQGDKDWVAVNLTAGTTYEFSANRLCATCDTYMEFYGTGGTTLLASGDDYIELDSRVRYTLPAAGTYYIMVSAFDPTYGVATYTLGARVFVDNDSDTYSSYYDCNDNDPSIYPGAAEVVGDGIDQDCSGTDKPVATNPDSAEPDNTADSARPMTMAEGNPWEIICRDDIYLTNTRTIHAGDDVDFFSVTVLPQSLIELDLVDNSLPGCTLNSTLYDSDKTTPLSTNLCGGYFSVTNTTSSSKTYYVKYYASDGASTGVYVPAWNSLGQDLDGDVYYSQNWDTIRDCNDAVPNINPAAIETPDDGIDSNCNGADNT